MTDRDTGPRPRVSVILAVRNGGALLAEALASLSAQAWRDWECVVVDDGSDDGSDRVLAAAAYADPRFRLLRQDRLGLVTALNRAIGVARGEFLARMDADDRAHPERFARQVAFLDAHPAVGVLGTAVRRIGAARGVWRRPVADADLRAALLFETPFAHPTVMMRRTVWVQAAGEGYREEFRAAEDIDLWERLATHTVFANLAEPLLSYRIHAGQVTALATETMANNGARVRRRWLERLGLRPDDAQMKTHEAIAWLQPGSAEDLRRGDQWLADIEAANRRTGLLEPTALAAILRRRWFEYCNAHSRLGLIAWRTHRQAAFGRPSTVSTLRRLRFGMLCVGRQLARGGHHA